MILKYFVALIMLCAYVVGAQAEDVKARIDGLENNSEYMTLLREASALAKTEVSLVDELEINRKMYNNGGEGAAVYRQRAIEIEQILIDLRVKKSGVTSKISAIEQRWAMDHSKSTMAEDDTTTPELESSQPELNSEDVMRIVQSRYTKATLSTMDIKNLVAAELADKRAAVMASSYASNYDALSKLTSEYDNASSQKEAESIIARYKVIDSINRVVARNISLEWGSALDNKSFAYAMLIERLGDTSIFNREEALKIQAAKVVDSLSAQTSSRELLAYYANRLSLVELEYSVATAMQLPRAADSLRRVRDSLRVVEFNYPSVSMTPRLFIDYEPIKFSSKPVYSGAKPIPYGKVYDQGVIYRLLVGSFKTRQAATLFRGAYPIYIFKNDAGMLSYYLGGYETRAEANKAREMLLKRGFRKPIVVEWRDGVAPRHTPKKSVSTQKYRVEIKGVAELSDYVRGTIRSQGSGRELSKVGGTTFVVGLFDDKKAATHLMESLKIVDSNISVSIVEVK